MLEPQGQQPKTQAGLTTSLTTNDVASLTGDQAMRGQGWLNNCQSRKLVPFLTHFVSAFCPSVFSEIALPLPPSVWLGLHQHVRKVDCATQGMQLVLGTVVLGGGQHHPQGQAGRLFPGPGFFG